MSGKSGKIDPCQGRPGNVREIGPVSENVREIWGNIWLANGGLVCALSTGKRTSWPFGSIRSYSAWEMTCPCSGPETARARSSARPRVPHPPSPRSCNSARIRRSRLAERVRGLSLNYAVAFLASSLLASASECNIVGSCGPNLCWSLGPDSAGEYLMPVRLYLCFSTVYAEVSHPDVSCTSNLLALGNCVWEMLRLRRH